MFSITIDWTSYLHPCCCIEPHRIYRYETLKPFHVLKWRVSTGTHQSSGNERVAPFDFTIGYMKLPCLSVCLCDTRSILRMSRDMGTYAGLYAVHLANVLYSYRSTVYMMDCPVDVGFIICCCEWRKRPTQPCCSGAGHSHSHCKSAYPVSLCSCLSSVTQNTVKFRRL